MVFGNKPKKPNSVKPGDKRKISLLNSDFKATTGIDNNRFKKLVTHTHVNWLHVMIEGYTMVSTQPGMPS
jgi:hypothetical protein